MEADDAFKYADENEAMNILLWLYNHQALLARTEDHLYYLEYTYDEGKTWHTGEPHPDPIYPIRVAMEHAPDSNLSPNRQCVWNSKLVNELRHESDEIEKRKKELTQKLSLMKIHIGMKIGELKEIITQ